MRLGYDAFLNLISTPISVFPQTILESFPGYASFKSSNSFQTRRSVPFYAVVVYGMCHRVSALKRERH